MRLNRLFAVLLSSCTIISTMPLAFAIGEPIVFGQVPAGFPPGLDDSGMVRKPTVPTVTAQAVSAKMERMNEVIEAEVQRLVIRCNNQIARKTFLDEEVKRVQPGLSALTSEKVQLENELKKDTQYLDLLQGQQSALKATIESLAKQIKDATLAGKARRKELENQISAATLAKNKFAKDIRDAEAAFMKYRAIGLNEQILNQAILYQVNKIPLTPGHVAALAKLAEYDAVITALAEKVKDAEADLVAAQKALSDLNAGRIKSLADLKTEIATKTELFKKGEPTLALAKKEVRDDLTKLRLVTARINTASSLVVPEVHRACAGILAVQSPQR